MKIKAVQNLPTLIPGEVIPAGEVREVEDHFYYREAVRNGSAEVVTGRRIQKVVQPENGGE